MTMRLQLIIVKANMLAIAVNVFIACNFFCLQLKQLLKAKKPSKNNFCFIRIYFIEFVEHKQNKIAVKSNNIYM